MIGSKKDGESFYMSFDPKLLVLTFEGGRLSRKVVTKVKSGKYFPIV